VDEMLDLMESDQMRIEQFPNFFKMVLAEFGGGGSLRLHVFPQRDIGSRHSHRWVFGSKVLVGRLQHNLYEEDTVYELREPGKEPLVSARVEFTGSNYVLWPSHVHSIEALEPTVTLVARGPEIRSRRFVDVPGIERGWARQYARPDQILAGAKVSRSIRSSAIEQAMALLTDGRPAAITPLQ